MNAIIALLVDSIRELRAKRLFWFVLSVSVLLVIVFGSIGFDENGVTMFYGLKKMENPYVRAGTPWPAILMEGIFSAFIVNFWLAWGAMILAIVSTAGMFPDFLADGSIDLVLSRPIRRATVFLVKYIGGLGFVCLQVLLFCAGVFLVMGLRLDSWRWEVFWAVPLVTLMFSYLYAIMTLVNVWTRSTLASLLVTVFAWLGMFGVHASHDMLYMAVTQAEVAIEVYESRLNSARTELESLGTEAPERQRVSIERRIEILEEDLDGMRRVDDALSPWFAPIHVVNECIPKTSETVALVQRWLEADTDLSITDLMQGNFGNGEQQPGRVRVEFLVQGDPEIGYATGDRMMDYAEGRSALYIIGTSLIFEGLILGVAIVIFMRKDY